MGILTINESTEFVDRIMDHADIALTGGRYFLGKFKERDIIIDNIKHIPMVDDLNKPTCNEHIGQIFERVLGGRPIQSCYYEAIDYSLNGRMVWAFDYEMPKSLNNLPNKTLHIKIIFK